MRKIISIITLVVLAVACVSEDRFERVNIGITTLTEEDIARDFSFGARFNTIFQNLTAGQSGEEHQSDTYVRHFATPSVFQNNINGATYNLHESWNKALWNRHYNSVMAPCLEIKKMAITQGLHLFAAWAELFQVTALSRLTTYHGPLIYSEYGQQLNKFVYDSEEYLYQQFFAELDSIQAVFQANLPTGNTTADADLDKIDARFDPSYEGDLAKWLKYINSLRLRLALRIVKVDPEWAKEMFEKAVNNPAGLILTNADNFTTSLYGSVFPHWQISDSWSDTRMGAGHEEVLLGYNDPRLKVWWQPVTGGPELYADHPDKPYKGIAGGAYLDAKDTRTPYSKLGTYFSTCGFRRFLCAEEVNFALAEAALRGWDVANAGGKSAQAYYEEGIRLSFNEWGITDADVIDAYISDDTSKPLRYYVDPKEDDNNYESRIDITIKWEESVDNERKLERIMMQKWIASFVNSNEMWSDFRRTGYPKLHYNPKNDSNVTFGLIGPNEFNKREMFIQEERLDNAQGIKETELKMGPGGDKISTRLWIHPEGPNF